MFTLQLLHLIFLHGQTCKKHLYLRKKWIHYVQSALNDILHSSCKATLRLGGYVRIWFQCGDLRPFYSMVLLSSFSNLFPGQANENKWGGFDPRQLFYFPCSQISQQLSLMTNQTAVLSCKVEPIKLLVSKRGICCITHVTKPLQRRVLHSGFGLVSPRTASLIISKFLLTSQTYLNGSKLMSGCSKYLWVNQKVRRPCCLNKLVGNDGVTSWSHHLLSFSSSIGVFCFQLFFVEI